MTDDYVRVYEYSVDSFSTSIDWSRLEVHYQIAYGVVDTEDVPAEGRALMSVR